MIVSNTELFIVENTKKLCTIYLFNIYNINKNTSKKLMKIIFDRYSKKTFHTKSLKLNRIEVLKNFCKKKNFLNFFFIILKNIKLFSTNFFYLNHFLYYKDLRRIDLAFKSRDEAEIWPGSILFRTVL